MLIRSRSPGHSKRLAHRRIDVPLVRARVRGRRRSFRPRWFRWAGECVASDTALSRRSAAWRTVVQAVLAVVVFAAMLVFAVSCAVKWVGVAPDLLLLLSMAGLGLASGLYLLGGAVMPRWERGLWRTSKVGVPRVGPPRVRVEIGRLVFLGAGIWFTAVGVAVLVVAVRVVVLGVDEPRLPAGGLPALMGALGIGAVIFLVGFRSDHLRVPPPPE